MATQPVTIEIADCLPELLGAAPGRIRPVRACSPHAGLTEQLEDRAAAPVLAA